MFENAVVVASMKGRRTGTTEEVEYRTMARNRHPITDDEIADRRAKMAEQRTGIRAPLADELGGDPDYPPDRPVTDGGE